MSKIKVLNLFSGIGSNRLNWDKYNVEVTSIELDPIAKDQYVINFPNDTIHCTDALEWIQEKEEIKVDGKRSYYYPNLEQYDIIAVASPCQSHTMFRMVWGHNIPDMTSLYGLMTFLKYKTESLVKKGGKKILWYMENVKSWYKPLVEPNGRLGRHIFWSNFEIPTKQFRKYDVSDMSPNQLNEFLSDNRMDISLIKKEWKFMAIRQMVRNGCDPLIGEYLLVLALEQLNEQ